MGDLVTTRLGFKIVTLHLRILFSKFEYSFIDDGTLLAISTKIIDTLLVVTFYPCGGILVRCSICYAIVFLKFIAMHCTPTFQIVI